MFPLIRYLLKPYCSPWEDGFVGLEGGKIDYGQAKKVPVLAL